MPPILARVPVDAARFYVVRFHDVLFADGFESGDSSIWSSVDAPPF